MEWDAAHRVEPPGRGGIGEPVSSDMHATIAATHKMSHEINHRVRIEISALAKMI